MSIQLGVSFSTFSLMSCDILMAVIRSLRVVGFLFHTFSVTSVDSTSLKAMVTNEYQWKLQGCALLQHVSLVSTKSCGLLTRDGQMPKNPLQPWQPICHRTVITTASESHCTVPVTDVNLITICSRGIRSY